MAKLDRSRRVLIASANPLFREGLQRVYVRRWGDRAELVGITASVDETMVALEKLKPDLVIVDYDDKSINRKEFLNRFVTGQSSLRVVLISLTVAGQVVIYDRRQLTSEQADEWFNDPWGEEAAFEEYQRNKRNRKQGESA